MSQANQVAVAGPSSLNLADPAGARNGQQHQIPRFLLKLYQILNDPANEELIKWSEAGDSFYIYHQDRIARELLGKWFKHQNFSSFVRQLNLYGFRKLSALQQGLLRMDHDNEITQFAHPYFHRGQPDLLALIQRKRHPPNHTLTEETAGLLQASQDGNLSTQAVDVRAIVEGINAIRHQQQVIAADLDALKRSNDALWKEAIEARQRHAKHEDTINRILKFLAGLFGRVVQGSNRDQLHGEGQTAPRGRMLMIGDGRPGHGDGASDFGGSDAGSRPASPFSTTSERFATIETPAASAASLRSPPASEANQPLNLPGSAPPDWHSSHPSTALGLHPGPPATLPSTSSSIPPPPTPAQGAPNPEALWQATFQQMLQSPEQFQRMAQAFGIAQQHHMSNQEQSHTSDFSGALQHPGYVDNTTLPSILQQATFPPTSLPVQPSQSSQHNPQQPLPYPLPVAPTAVVPPPTYAEQALLDNNARMQKAYRDTAEINADVDVLQSSIHSLIRDMGLDPQNPVLAADVPPGATGEHADFPFDSWLEQLSNGGTGFTYPTSPGRGSTNGGDDFSAFLDIPNEAGPMPTAIPNASATSPAGQKRKLDDAEIPKASSEAEPPASKKKR
ncbi:Heat shock factor protein [Trametes pubescens]|uniref:Heat shock factor protein n=1 Tax=Trametes pubescens TaxID=154538 RepID=A0A1M2V4V3_TRAPU|nr:Heat shock factor protein [Trametes pubescens]